MAKDPRKNSLVEVIARENKLQGTIDVLQDRPELISDGSGSFIVYSNDEGAYTVFTADPRGDVQKKGIVTDSNESVEGVVYRKGLSAANGKFGSPFQPVELNLLETFGEASNLENPGQSGSLIFLDGKGRYPNNAINYKQQEFIKDLNIKWSGRQLLSSAPFITQPSEAYQLTVNDYKKRWSPDASRQFQSGNIWFRPPVQNLWDSEVIWKLISGSNFETGNRVGRALVSGTVGSLNLLTPIEDPYVFTTGSDVSDFGSDTSENRFLEGGAIRDNSTSVTLGHHFRPNNFLTRQKAANALIFDIRNEENSGKLVLGQQFRTISRYQLSQLSSSADIFGDIDFSLTESLTRPSEKTSNFYRSSDLFVSDLVYQSGSLVKSFSRETGVPVDRFEYTQSDTDEFALEKEGLFRTFDIGDSPTTSADLVDCSLSPLFDVLLYDFSILTGKIKEELPFFPDKIYLGDPIRIYFGDIAGGLNGIRVKTFNLFKEIVLLTSQGQIFLKRDLGFTDSDFENKFNIDLSDPRIYFNSEFNQRGFFNRENPLALDPALRVEIAGILGLYEKSSLLNQFGIIVSDRSYRQIGLQYYKVPRKYYTYFNSNGHFAHHLDNEPYSYIRGGSTTNPSRDPGFDSQGLESLGYRKTDDIIPAIQDADNDSSFYFRLYNSQLGEPFTRNFNPKNITNFVSNFKYDFDIRSSGNYNFTDSSEIDFSRNDRTPFVQQGLPGNFKAFILNSQESVDINDAGFLGSGDVPILPYDTSNENSISDALGNIQVRNIKSDYFPIFDKNGDINSFIGSNIFVNIKNREENQEQNSREIPLSLLRVTKDYPNFVFNMNDEGKLGFFSYNPERDIGVGYDLYLGSSPAFYSASLYSVADSIANSYGGLNKPIDSILLNRHSSYFGVPYYYFAKLNGTPFQNVLASLAIIPECLSIKSKNFYSSSFNQSKYIGSIITANRTIAGTDRIVFSDFDSGILSATVRNPTKNFLNPKNSDAFIYVDSEGKQRNGIFVAPKSNSSSSSFYTGSVKYSYLYDGIVPNSTWTHTPQGFTQNQFSTEFLPNNRNNLLRPEEKFSFERRGSKNGNDFVPFLLDSLPFNGQFLSRNNMAFCCYTTSDSEDVAGQNNFNGESLFESIFYTVVPSTKPEFVNFPEDSFLTIPFAVSQSFNVPVAGAQSVSQSLAWANMQTAMTEYLNPAPGTVFYSHYDTKKFFLHPKAINYSLAPRDQFFGTAFLDESSQKRQVTKQLKFYVENSVWQDIFDYSSSSFYATSPSANYLSVNFRSPNIGTDNSTSLFGLPAGTYTWILNIQDMIMPVKTEVWSEFGINQKPNLFSPINREGVDNGLRSNFYFNIPLSNVNKSLFNNPNVIRTSNSILMNATFNAITGSDSNNGSDGGVRYVVVTGSSSGTGIAYGLGNATLRISDASAFEFLPSSGTLDQYKGVFIPDLEDKQLGVEGLNIEGSIDSQLPNGEFEQPIKRIRIDLFIDETLPLTSFAELCSLGVSFRPNSQLPQDFLEPLSSENSSEIDSYSYYDGYEYENLFKMNRGEALCFARVSTFGSYTSLWNYRPIGDKSIFEGSPKYINSVQYDPFNHTKEVGTDIDLTKDFMIYRLENNVGTYNVDDNAVTYRTALGYHSLLSHGDSCGEFEIGSLTGSNYQFDIDQNPYLESNNAFAVNRSIIDQGGSMNIIQLCGIAVNSETR